jgi:hypothetical protein
MWLRQESLDELVTPEERKVLDGKNAGLESYQEQVEALWALLWVAGLTPVLDPAVECPNDLVHDLPDLRVDPMPTSRDWRDRARWRKPADQIKALDIMTCLAQAFDTAKATGRPTPQLQGGRWVKHRLNALAWATGSAPWTEPVAVHPKWWGKKSKTSV